MPFSGLRVANLPRRHLRGTFWHQGATGHDLTSFADPAISEGRYHQAGGAGVWYASDQEQAAWAELFRHLLATELDAFEVRRRVGKVVVNDLEVLDLTDATVRDSLGLGSLRLGGRRLRPHPASGNSGSGRRICRHSGSFGGAPWAPDPCRVLLRHAPSDTRTLSDRASAPATCLLDFHHRAARRPDELPREVITD